MLVSGGENQRVGGTGRIGVAFYPLSAALFYGILFLGVPIAQAAPEDRRHRYIFLIAVALCGIVAGIAAARPARPSRLIRYAAVALPTYALFQIVPLPIGLVAALSPARAELVRALEPVTGRHAFASLSIVPALTLAHFLLFTAYCIVFLSLRELAARAGDKVWILAIPMVLAAAFEAALGLVQFFSGGDIPTRGTYLIRNNFAGLLEMALPFAVIYTLDRLGAARRAFTAWALIQICSAGAVSVLLLSALLCSLSRGGLVGMLVSAVVAGAFAIRRMAVRGRLAVILLFALVVSLGVFYVAPVSMVERLAQHNASGRLRLWRQALGVVRLYPLTGCGLGGFESAFLKFKSGWGLLTVDYAHNDYLQYLAELGFAGFAIGVALFGSIGIRLVKSAVEPSRKRWFPLACLSSLSAIAVHSFADFNLYVAANAAALAWICGMSCGMSAGSNPSIQGRFALRRASAAIAISPAPARPKTAGSGTPPPSS